MAKPDGTNSVYQSGQSAPVTGLYEAVGARQSARQFEKGTMLPNFDGRAICWVLVSYDSARLETSSRIAGGLAAAAGTQPQI